MYSKDTACCKHFDFFKVKVPADTPHNEVQQGLLSICFEFPNAHPQDGPVIHSINPTTSFLTTTTLIYAIGAGITAAAGTRLALQWVLTNAFSFSPYPLADFNFHDHCPAV